METEIIIKLKPYSLKEIADIYGISTKTLTKWMAPLRDKVGIRRGRYYTIKQVRIIFDELELPGEIRKKVTA